MGFENTVFLTFQIHIYKVLHIYARIHMCVCICIYVGVYTYV